MLLEYDVTCLLSSIGVSLSKKIIDVIVHPPNGKNCVLG
jgi:hypothetical protein